jgi:hypothetical protein
MNVDFFRTRIRLHPHPFSRPSSRAALIGARLKGAH